MRFNLRQLARCSLLFLGVWTILATSKVEKGRLAKGEYSVSSDCQDASLENGSLSLELPQEIGVETVTIGENYQDYGFPDQSINYSGGEYIVAGADRVCSALEVLAIENLQYLFLCRNPNDEALQCTILLKPRG